MLSQASTFNEEFSALKLCSKPAPFPRIRVFRLVLWYQRLSLPFASYDFSFELIPLIRSGFIIRFSTTQPRIILWKSRSFAKYRLQEESTGLLLRVFAIAEAKTLSHITPSPTPRLENNIATMIYERGPYLQIETLGLRGSQKAPCRLSISGLSNAESASSSPNHVLPASGSIRW